jgi:hypothetical protein
LRDVVARSVTIYVEAKHLTPEQGCEILRCAQDDMATFGMTAFLGPLNS